MMIFSATLNLFHAEVSASADVDEFSSTEDSAGVLVEPRYVYTRHRAVMYDVNETYVNEG